MGTLHHHHYPRVTNSRASLTPPRRHILEFYAGMFYAIIGAISLVGGVLIVAALGGMLKSK
ncbi:MAG: hypothetical protein JWQ43_1559 [Glaciihabitans sp.]|nr:hypothetical protein [Glaciihabitans sp.]